MLEKVNEVLVCWSVVRNVIDKKWHHSSQISDLKRNCQNVTKTMSKSTMSTISLPVITAAVFVTVTEKRLESMPYLTVVGGVDTKPR